MSSPSTVAIIGLGLMGGSLARDLSSRSVRILGYDAGPEVLERARAEGIVAEALPADLSGVEAADTVVLATPVDVALDVLSLLARQVGSRSVITDVGSTKRSIGRRAMEVGLGARFVGSHPLAGDHRSGWKASRAGLYRGASVFICPTAESTQESIDRVNAFWSDIGGIALTISAEEHDRRIAWISHLPQIVSSTLSALLLAEGITTSDLGPGGRDMVRLADSSPEMWSAICQSNADHLLVALTALRERLEGVERLIADGNAGELRDFFREGRGPTV